MKKIQIADNLFCFQFPEEQPENIAFNITVLTHGTDALIIDAAYPAQAEQVVMHLKRSSINPQTVIISHFHPDHILGVPAFQNCQIMGSKNYKTTLYYSRMFNPKLKFQAPQTLLSDDQLYQFGTFQLKFIETPGHTTCSICTVIKKGVLHIGDVIISKNNGDFYIPLVSAGSKRKDYIESLDRLIALEPEVVIPSHGKILYGEKTIKEILLQRKEYLEKSRKNGNPTHDLILENDLQPA